MTISLEDQVILITGASRGIGAGIARALAKSRASLALHYGKNREKAEMLAQETGGKSRAFGADLRDPMACKELFASVLAHYGRVDCLINNAGIAIRTEEGKDFATWLQAWQDSLQVNLLASAILAREAIAHFRERKGGRLIFISSRAAFRGDTPDFMAYAASKGGMVSLSRSIARGYGKEGIKSFLIAPGFIKTDMAQQFIDEYGEKFILDDLALSELTLPKDLAPTLVFLASGYMDHATGATIDINAGSYVH